MSGIQLITVYKLARQCDENTHDTKYMCTGGFGHFKTVFSICINDSVMHKYKQVQSGPSSGSIQFSQKIIVVFSGFSPIFLLSSSHATCTHYVSW